MDHDSTQAPDPRRRPGTRIFDPPRNVEVLVDGMWTPGKQREWQLDPRNPGRWRALVTYGGALGQYYLMVPQDEVRLPAAQGPGEPPEPSG